MNAKKATDLAFLLSKNLLGATSTPLGRFWNKMDAGQRAFQIIDWIELFMKTDVAGTSDVNKIPVGVDKQHRIAVDDVIPVSGDGPFTTYTVVK